ncbi:MAG: tetratricopeptide repeat protein [Myxococcota bacterium]
MAAAHAAGLVHRDFKPDNVIVDQQQRPRVLDFGLACATEESEAFGDVWSRDSGAIERSVLERLTATGILLGTPAYMAPEVLANKPATVQSDQFSFCVALYEALYGHRPFPGKTPEAWFMAMHDGRLRSPPADRPAIPRWLFRVLQQGLSLWPQDRFPSMTALLTALERDRRFRWSPVLRRLGMVGGVVGLILSLGWWSLREEPPMEVAKPELMPDVGTYQRCTLPVRELRIHWDSVRDDWLRWHGDGDADAIERWGNNEVDAFVESWQSSCEDDPEGKFDSCREQAAADFRQLLDMARSDSPPSGMFSTLDHKLELCLESRLLGSCQSRSLESEASRLLAEGRGWALYGWLDLAREKAERSLKLARQSGDQLIQVRAQVLLGGIEQQSGAIETARTRLDEAAALAMACHDDVLLVDVELERAEVEVLHGGWPEDARRALRTVRKLLERPTMRDMNHRRVQLMESEGGVAFYLERHCERALTYFEDGLKLTEAEVQARVTRGEPVKFLLRRLSAARLNRASALTECGGRSPDEVIAEFESARNEFFAAVGNADHPAGTEYEFNLGVVQSMFGRYEEALEHFQHALQIYILHHGPDNPRVGDAHRALAESLRKLDRLDDARYHAQANLEIRLMAERWEGVPLRLAEAYDMLGVIEAGRGYFDEAVQLHQQAIEVLDSSSRTQRHTAIEVRQLVVSYTNLSVAWWGLVQRRDPRADEEARDAIRGARRWLASIPDEPPLAMLVLMEARLLDQQGDSRQACRHAKSFFEVDGTSNEMDVGQPLRHWIDTHCSNR